MDKKKLSIKDIAKQLNTSITTVSFVLNGKAQQMRISKDLEQRILKLVEESEYKPSQVARSLRTGKTKIIGLMVEDISNPFFSNVARLIEEKAYKKGYKIFYCSTENNVEKTKELIGMFRDRNVDGYIITPPEGIAEEVQSIIDAGFPVILFDRYFHNIQTDYVVVDNYGSTYRAVNHLIREGFKNIALVTLDSEQTQMQERLKGYQQALAEHHAKSFIKQILFDSNSEKTKQDIKVFLKKFPEIDAVFFTTNYLAHTGLEAINKLGLKIPSDIGVISFDDHLLFRMYNPSITAVAQPMEEMSAQLINILLKKLDLRETETEKVVLPGNLIIRESSRLSK